MSDPAATVVEVIAGVITDARGRILLARRTEGRDLAGLWEFPGGKREPDETAEAALARELREELGISVEIGERLIRVPHAYAHKRLQLDVRRIEAWRGTPKGREGQALAWAAPTKLPSYPMPSADRPVVAALLQADRYLVTPGPADGTTDAHWLVVLQRALDAGIRRLQLRAPACPPERWRGLVHEAVARCIDAGAEVLVNGDAQLATASGAGLHLRHAQLAQFTERSGLPTPLAASCHDSASLAMAQALGCDFAVLGPLQATASHPGAAIIGWEGFARMREDVSLPVYAIGGLTPVDIPTAREHGAQGIAATRGLWSDR